MKHLGSAKKYLQSFRLSLLAVTAFRWQLLFTFTHVPLLFIAYSAIWSRGFELQGTIQDYSFSIFMVGLMTSVVLRNMIGSTAAGEEVERHIQDGTILVYLTRPVSFFWNQFMHDCSRVLIKVIFGIPILLLIRFWLIGTLPQLDHVVMASILAASGLFIFFQLNFIAGTTSFWIGETWGIRNMIGNFTWLFGGAIVPVTFFPTELKLLSIWLPFQYAIFLPSELLLGRAGIESVAPAFLILMVWAIILFIVQQGIWNAGLHHHDGRG